MCNIQCKSRECHKNGNKMPKCKRIPKTEKVKNHRLNYFSEGSDRHGLKRSEGFDGDKHEEKAKSTKHSV